MKFVKAEDADSEEEAVEAISKKKIPQVARTQQ